MTTIEYRTVDKSQWGDGPWQSEPDKKQWTGESGLPCLIVRGPHGALNGYVGVPKGHPAYGEHYDSIDVRAHGGLTYASHDKEKPTRAAWRRWRTRALARRGEATQYPVGDAARLLSERAKEIEDYDAFVAWVTASNISNGGDEDLYWLGFDCAHSGDMAPAYGRYRFARFEDDAYRDIAYVTAEVESLAEQLQRWGKMVASGAIQIRRRES